MDTNIWEKDEYYREIEKTHMADDAENDIGFLNIFRLLNNSAGKSVLDLGCGEGWLIGRLSARLDDSSMFVGVDVSRTGLIKAQSRNISNAKFVDYDGDVLPFSDGQFDAVISSFVFEHLADPLTTFKEMSRVVKRDGIMIIICPNFGSPLFRSPCNRTNRPLLMLGRFMREFLPASHFKNSFHWNLVTPIELPADVHISDYDTLCEPDLSSFTKYLQNHKDKYSIIEAGSLWESFNYGNDYGNDAGRGRLHFIKSKLVNAAKFFGIKRVFRFQYFGSFFFAAVKKL